MGQYQAVIGPRRKASRSAISDFSNSRFCIAGNELAAANKVLARDRSPPNKLPVLYLSDCGKNREPDRCSATKGWRESPPAASAPAFHIGQAGPRVAQSRSPAEASTTCARFV